jgi:hypothetical protein
MIRRNIQLTWSLVLTSLIFLTICSCSSAAAPTPQQLERIQKKAAIAKQGVIAWKRSGKDPSRMLKLMSQVKPALDKKQFKKVESLLDSVLEMLKEGEGTAVASTQYDGPVTDEFKDPKKVEIVGYDGDAMEPSISRDGKYLFFNNLNDPHVDTNIYYARKIGNVKFEFIGEVKGVNSKELDGVPSLDKHNKFYFVSGRDYKNTFSTLYCGDFRDGEVKNVKQIKGDLSRRKAHWINIDLEISPDGNMIYYTDNEMQQGGVPKSSNILIASENNGEFNKIANADEIMKNINTDELEYAPSITNNGLELFFTRASNLIVGNQSAGSNLRVYVAKRKGVNEPFGEPSVISTIEGFVEGPSVTKDGRTLYYHKKDGSRFYIYRVVRKK